jgi:hypothetical protein
MKFGQTMSILEAALPEEMAAPFRATLTPAAGRRTADVVDDGAQCARVPVRCPLAATVPLL